MSSATPRISVPTTSDLAAFLDAVFPGGFESDEMLERISDWEVHDPAPSTLRMGWRWIVAPEWDGNHWDFAGRVEFPTGDLPAIIQRLQQTAASA